MDGSFLSDADVVAASRKFVCIRLSTYEDAEEAEFLRSIYVGRSGDLENTVFAILSPDGKRTPRQIIAALNESNISEDEPFDDESARTLLKKFNMPFQKA